MEIGNLMMMMMMISTNSARWGGDMMMMMMIGGEQCEVGRHAYRKTPVIKRIVLRQPP